ncbi:hypothetical protein A4G28_24090 [Mycobacterium ostraviense]|uniref:Uncharacterized protein n=1 Tax=Mycobacterium ostraviense TaxID=2738409 RepID=A0A163Z116_9MYCO|nr:hypothetical protein A4G28_24090 [Mycobacterium ostraviense]
MSTLPAAVQSLAAPPAVSSPATSPLDDFFNNNLVINIGQAAFDTVAWNMFALIASSILNGKHRSGVRRCGFRRGCGRRCRLGRAGPVEGGTHVTPLPAGVPAVVDGEPT